MSVERKKIAATFILAFVSLMYELIIAQSISSYMGSTFLVYCITIGSFTLSLGLGSFVFDSINKDIRESFFVYSELVLSFFGGLSPLIIFFFYSIGSDVISAPVLFFILLIPGFICGFFSGFELPYLMADLKSEQVSFKVLFSDYAGMFLATVLFPLALLPFLNLFSMAAIMGLCNLIVLYLYPRSDKTNLKRLVLTLGSLSTLVLLFTLIMNQNILMQVAKVGL